MTGGAVSGTAGGDEVITPCPLCGVPRPDGARCPACGLTGQFGPDRPSPFVGATLWAMMGAIALVFAVTLLVVGIAASS